MEEITVNKKFWNKKSVLVTGYEGFLGSNLTKALISAGIKVVGVDINSRKKNTIFTNADYSAITRINADVADYEAMCRIISRHKINIIFHLAAEALVGECNQNPRRAFLSNICGTWNILEAARNSPYIKAIVAASSDKAYGSHKELPYKENAALQGEHPYDVSKSCADMIAHTYHHTYGLPVAITRCGNIYGPGDFNFSRIVPDAIRCMLLGKTLLIRSDGNFTRDYIYVDDIVNGYILLAEKLQKLSLSGEAFNCSNENPVSVLELIKIIYRIARKKENYKILNKANYEIKHQFLSAKKAKKILGWKPRYTLDKGLIKTIQWYEEVLR